MTSTILPMDRDKVISFISHNINNSNPFSCIQNNLLQATFSFIPYIGNYKEEDQVLSFKLSVGINTTTAHLSGRFYHLHQYECTNSDSSTQISEITNMIKKSAALCTTDANIYILQNETTIECGIYYTDLEMTGYSEESLLENNFIIFQHHQKNQIEMIAKNNCTLICFDLETAHIYNPCLPSSPDALSNTKGFRTWKGIFEKVKKHVHGTICLFVKELWDPANDTNFTEKINPIEIKLFRSYNSSANDINEFNNKVDILISMLNYDGITIIDTSGTIRAYNLFCKSQETNNAITGGARHRAYESLKSIPQQNRSNYIAIYFQSQEGHIEYFEYNKPNVTESCFNPNIINSGYNTPFLDTVKEHIDSDNLSQTVNSLDYPNTLYYFDIQEHVNNLQDAHDGVDNFYNEPKPANELLNILRNPDYLQLIQKEPILSQQIINTTIECIIGNSYGFSYDAQEALVSIIDLFDESTLKHYFDNGLYICHNLIYILSTTKLYSRWKEICNHIIGNYPNLKDTISKYTLDDFVNMYRALNFLENN